MVDIPQWLKQVHAEEKKVPLWLSQVIDHPQFAALHKEATGFRLFTMEDQHMEAPDLPELCQKFTDHYSR